MHRIDIGIDSPKTLAGAMRRAALALAALLSFAAGACGDGDDGGGVRVRVEQGVVGELLGGDTTGLLTARGLFGFTGELIAVDADGNESWVVALPGGAVDIMRADDGTIYVSLFDRVVAVDATGRLLPFDGAAGGQLAMHPSGRPMVFGDGFTVLDHDGYPFLTALSGTAVHAAAVDSAGQILALVTHTPGDGEPDVVRIYAYTERFEPIWWADIDPPGVGGGDLAVGEDFIAISYGTTTEARASDGAPLWRVNNAGGPLLVGPGETTYILGANNAAVTRAGEVLWSVPLGARLVLTDRGLGAIWTGTDRFGSELTAVGFLDPATGEVLESTSFPAVTEFVAPAVIGGRLVAAGYAMNTSQSFNPGGDIVVSQGAERAYFTGGSAELGGGWASVGGPGSTRSGPIAAKMPTEDGLFGFWVARDGTRVRALQFADQSFDFNLFGGRVYGIWDHDTREKPRLVQVGSFAVEDDTVTLAPVRDLTAGLSNEGRSTLRLYTSPPGGLRIDDPLQPVTRTFARAGRIPPVQAPGYAPPSTTGLIAEEGPSDRNAVRLVAEVPGSDDLWVVSEYDYQGKLGGRQYLGSNIRVNGNNVTGNLFNTVVARLDPDGDTVASWHINTPLTMVPRAILPEGDGQVRLVGPVPIGATNPVIASAVVLAQRGEDLEPVLTAPWPAERCQRPRLRQPGDGGRPRRWRRCGPRRPARPDAGQPGPGGPLRVAPPRAGR